MKLFVALVALIALTMPVMGTVYDRCSLARAMFKLGVPKADLNKWACIAQHESSFNTAAVGPTNGNGSRDYGIFQINNKYWCKPSSGNSFNSCNVNCDSLLTNDINASVKCAQQIQKKQGWRAWSTWRYCSYALPSIDDCF